MDHSEVKKTISKLVNQVERNTPIHDSQFNNVEFTRAGITLACRILFAEYRKNTQLELTHHNAHTALHHAVVRGIEGVDYKVYRSNYGKVNIS